MEVKLFLFSTMYMDYVFTGVQLVLLLIFHGSLFRYPSMSDVHGPLIIKFAFTDLTVLSDKDKWTAKCRSCKQILTEKRGTMSAFNK